MHDGAAQTMAGPSLGLLPRLRGRMALTFAVVVLAACLVSAGLLLARAMKEQQAIETQALATATALSFGFDQEVAAVNYLLKGLSKSPALLSGDTKSFYDQLKATPVPEGSWLVLNDMERQVVNTLRPLGSPLPRHSDFVNYQEQIDRIRDRRWSVSGRILGLVRGAVVVALSLRLDDPEGRMSGYLTTVLSDERLSMILREQNVPPGWTKGLYDRKLQPIVTERDGRTGSGIPPPSALGSRLADAGPDVTIQGTFVSVDEQGLPVFIAFRRSGATTWTAAITVPLAALDAPLRGVLWQVAGAGVALLLAGGAAALFMARQVERPLRTLSDQVTGAEHQVSELSRQVLALQEEERRRIARELHDSTAQHLVAAHLGLASLEGAVAQTSGPRKVIMEIDRQLGEALRELRVFTYLLHPPNLSNDGLQATLRDFSEGFADRTGLVARIRIPEEVDAIASDLQRTILRVVQEALTNVHRHADATRVSVAARIAAEYLMVRVCDDGRGMTGPNRIDGPVRLGVGIAGMRARLEQFGGSLRIRTGPSGTSIVAVVPVVPATATVRVLTQARRLFDPWLRGAAKMDDGTLT